MLAETLEWSRNKEADVKEYHIYACYISGCPVSKNSAFIIGVVIQPASTRVRPTFNLPIDKVGTAAVTAVDLMGNESDISNTVSFNTFDPAAPTGLIRK